MVKFRFPASLFLFLLFMAGSQWGFGQFIGFEDAPTQRGNVQRGAGTLEGMVVEKRVGATPDEKDVTITFILTEMPSAFFDYYDLEKKAVVLDLYDVEVGESAIDTLKEHPITHSYLEQTQVDLNKEVAGLKPDLRTVVRITLFTPYNLSYAIEEEFGVVTLKFKWSRKIEKKLNRSKNSIYWKFPLATAVLAGIGYYSYDRWFKEETVGPSCPVCDEAGELPNHPGN